MEQHVWEPVAEFGPAYPVLPVSKFRKAPQESAEVRKAYGEAVLASIRELQLRELFKSEQAAPVSNKCYASGTAHSCGHKILEAVRKQNLAKLHVRH